MESRKRNQQRRDGFFIMEGTAQMEERKHNKKSETNGRKADTLVREEIKSNEDIITEKIKKASNEQAINGKGSRNNNNNSRKDVEQSLNKDRKEPYKILYQNIRRLVTKNSKKQKGYLKEYVQ